MAVFSLSKIITLLQKANEQHVNISFAEEVLSVQVPKGKQIDKALLEELRDNKPFLIHYFKNFSHSENGNGILAIQKAIRDEHTKIPASFAQERLWFIHQVEGSLQYHLPTIIRLRGSLNIEAIRYVLQNIINRHEALRTVIVEKDGRVYQEVQPKDEWQLNTVDGAAYKNEPELLQNFIQQLIAEPFNLSADAMLRAHLIRMEAEEHILVVTMHHLASDAWSEPILINEVLELYSAFTQGRNPQLPDVEIQYADYAIWQRNYLQGDVLDKKLDYWKEKLDAPETLQLPVNTVRPINPGSKGDNFSFTVDKHTVSQLNSLCQEQSVTLFMLLLSVYKILLYRYSGQRDITVGTSIASRQQRELEGLIGYFVNTLALRDEIDPAASFTELLQQVKATTLGAYQHQDVPFEKVVEAVVNERNTGRNPLFQVMLVLANTPKASRIKMGGLEVSFEATAQTTAKFDITFFINETPEGLEGRVQYSTDLYSAAFIRRMTVHFSNLLKAGVSNPQAKAGSLSMLAKEEETQLLHDFNTASVTYPSEKSIIELFEEQAAKMPEQPAVVFDDESLTYQELNERSNQLAHYLRSKGAGPGKLIPLYVERSAAMMVGMLGILKAGAAYVPVDTDFPQERINYMLQNTDATLVVSNSSVSANLEDADVEIVEIDDTMVSYQPKTNLTVKPLPQDVAYVIYTSGSTGTPKGVMVTHQNLVDYYFGLDKYTAISQCQSFALVSTIATDLGNTVIFASLLSGGALHVFSKTSVSNAAYLQRYFGQQQIDCVKIVPSHWKALSTDDELLLPEKLIIFGGEALPAEAVQAIRSSGSTCAIVNHYGPTETTIGKLLLPVQPDADYSGTIPIGKPFSNTRVYVLTSALQLCPQGVPGQLFIAGHGVAKGYYNNEPLTAEKFINNPFIFSNTEKAEWGKMYATGDKVKWLPDGNILFMGRADDQVKIRGYRVEPGEVESILQQCHLVKAAAVVAIEDKQNDKKLVAYIVPQDEFDREEILVYLKEKLPEYMVPAVLIEIDTLPLTANGKINRKALPHPDEGETSTGQYVAPRSETETTMAALWADILELEENEVGIHNDFFELGGHSLLAVRLVSGIRKAFGVEVPIGDVFDYPTVAGLAGRLQTQSEKTVMSPIAVQVKPELIPLSFSQERLWFIDQLGGSVPYHVPAVLRLKGSLDKQALSHALVQIINRHEVLRTVILEKDGQPYQSVKNTDSWELQLLDGSGYSGNEAGLQAQIQQLINQPFHLSEDYMLRATLISLGADDYVLVATLHHIASDAWSSSIVVNELMEFYHAGLQKRAASLIPLPIQYADYAIWQRSYLQGELLSEKLAYWKNKLQGTAALQLYTDHPRPPAQSTNGAVRTLNIEKELAGRLQALSQQQGTTLFMTLLGVLQVLLYRYTGQQDICIGTPIAGRQQGELETLIGFFVNTLALRCKLDDEASFAELLQQVKDTTLEAYEHQDVPFEKVVETVVEDRDVSRSPLFQVMLVWQNTPKVNKLQLDNLELYPAIEGDYPHTTSKFDLTFNVAETADGLTLAVEYCTDLYLAATIDKMMVHYHTLLQAVVKNPQQKISLLPMLSLPEQQQLLETFNDTLLPYPTEQTILDLLETQALQTPSATALIHEQETITYQQLAERSNQLAHYLISKGVTTQTLVPVCIERGIHLVTAILAILKAGAAYVPIDPEYPADRISYMLEDTAAQLMVTSTTGSQKLPQHHQLQIIEVDKEAELINQQPLHPLSTTIAGSQVAYIIYTSGSTGKPKGVQITHSNVASFIHWCHQEFAHSRFDIAYLTTSVCFDLSIFEMFYPLSTGKPIRILQNGLQMADYLSKDRRVMVNTVPSVIQSLLTEGTDLTNVSVLNMAGEPIPLQVQQQLDTDTIEVRNLYGPTESTTYSTFAKLDNKQPVTIGKPVGNTVIYLLGPAQQLVPAGVAGEIYISGASLAQGYLNRPELTAERFVANPFSREAGIKMYRTGDIGRWLPDGNIAYLGRTDSQVKVRGYRIELGEIENVLQQSGLVESGVILAREAADGSKQLAGYAVAKTIFDKEAVISYLKNRLPEYMVPAIWVEMKALPLTPNGKVDRKALPDIDPRQLAGTTYQEPRNQLEAGLATIWQEILLVDKMGVYDNFFERGGHSLMAIRVVSAIRKKLQVELSIKDLFYYPTIATLATHLEKQHTGLVLPPIEPYQPRPEHIPLSFSQERLWFIDQLGGSAEYHVPAVFRVKGSVHKQALSHALQQIVNRHEVLRTVMLERDGQPYQSIKETNGWELQLLDGSGYSGDEGGLQAHIQRLVNQPFRLSEDYMLRAALISLGDDEHILVATLHHIASDAWSLPIIVREVKELYTAYVQDYPSPLPALPIQYADYAIWQRNYLQGDVLERKLTYWKNKLEDVSALQLPADFSRPAVQTTSGQVVNFSIDAALTETIHQLSGRNGTTLFMTLLAAFKVLLYRYSGQQDICVGTHIAGRQQQEVEELIGFFINTLALRTEISAADSFIQLLAKVKHTTVEAYEHQEVPFEKVVDAVVKERDMSRSPVFQVTFVLQNITNSPEMDLPGLTVSAAKPNNDTSKFDVSFFVTNTANGLQGSVEYNTDLFTAQTITRLIGHYQEILRSVARNPQQGIGLLPMLSLPEQQQLLETFNDTALPYPTEQTIIDLLEEQAFKSPSATALIHEQETITYQQLAERSNQLAHYLVSKGVTPQTLVPVCIERGIHLVTAILAILKAGAAYVPIDPEYPADRISYMLEDTAAQLMVTSTTGSQKLPQHHQLQIIEVDKEAELINQQPLHPLSTTIAGSQVAYIIYTSGSTGKPKGVQITHSNVASFIHWCHQEFAHSRFDIAYLTTSVCFDLSIFEIFYPLSTGKPIRILQNGLQMADYLSKDRRVMVNTVPSVIQSLLTEGTDLTNVSVLNMAGEPIPLQVQQQLDTDTIEVRNLYGPTESTTYSTFAKLDNKQPVTIGKPVGNTVIYLLGPAQQLVPAGVAGEIYISGAGLAQGYLNRPELTAERFVDNPFSKEAGVKMYRTGDIGRWLPDGNIAYLGRMDSQVKIRGYRIELGEIENVLQQSGLVESGVVLARENGEGSKRLTGYVVPAGNYTKEAVLSYLRSRLPEYMVPQLWMELTAMPQTTNGKVDRKALPDIDNQLAGTAYVEPRNEFEQQLAATWQQLLGIQQAGIHDNFFELGGDSILTIQVVSRMRRQGYELQPRDLFLHQTVAKLSAAITGRQAAANTAEQGILSGSSGLLPIQQSYLQKGPAAVSHYNQSVLLSIDKSITENTLQKVLAQLLQQHDALRFRYTKMEANEWLQEYGNAAPTVLFENLATVDGKDTSSLSLLITEKADHHQQQLNIEKGELVRAVLMQTPAAEAHNRLLIVIHHLAVDGVSWRILLDDLEQLLNAISENKTLTLGTKTSSYRQWYQALQQHGQSRSLQLQKAYWQHTAESFEPLPVDKNYDGKSKAADILHYSTRLGAVQTKQLLQDVPQVYHTEINDLLLAALAITLTDWAGTNKTVIGLEGHGREAIGEGIDVSRTVGWFTSLYPVLLEVKDDEGEGDIIKSVKEQLRKLPGRGIGYGVLRYINKEEELQTANDGWDIIFNYLGQLDNVVKESRWLQVATESRGAFVSGLNEIAEKLSVNSSVRHGELIIDWGYSTRYYENETIVTLAENFVYNLERLIAHCVAQQLSGPVFTPSDYGLGAEVTYRELDKFLAEPVDGKPRKEAIQSLYPLSGLQQGMLFHSLYDENGGGAYMEQFTCDLHQVNLRHLRKSWEQVIQNHSILRSGFYYDVFGIPVQCVYQKAAVPVEEVDFSQKNAEHQATAIMEYQAQERTKGFDFTDAPLMRIGLLKLANERYRMVWTFHHILLDGWSAQVLMEEFLTAYEALATGTTLPAQEADNYEDYIRYIQRMDKEAEGDYWRNYLRSIEQGTLLPFISNVKLRNKGSGTYRSKSLHLSDSETGALRVFAQSSHLTINTVIQGVWAMLLHHYTGHKDIVYGVTVSGRPDNLPDVEKRVGMYINTLPLHSNMEEQQTVTEWLATLQNHQVASRQYQYTPVPEIQNWIGVPGDLFDSLLVFENFPLSEAIGSKKWLLQIDNVHVHEQTNYPLNIIVSGTGNLTIRFDYNTALLDNVYVENMGNHFRHVLFQLIARNDARLVDIKIITQPEERQLLTVFNNDTQDYPADKTIIDLFEEQVAKTPTAVAVVFEGAQLTYSELHKRSNQLAHYLLSLGVQQETLVPICLPRSAEMIIGILGVLKAGGAYVAISTDYPPERINFMLEDCAATLIICNKKSESVLPVSLTVGRVDIEDSRITLQPDGVVSLTVAPSPQHLAYVMYTSASTGRAKGVLVQHGNVVSLVKGVTYTNFSGSEVLLATGSIAFDASTFEYWGMLLNGGRLVLCADQVLLDIRLLKQEIAAQGVTQMWFTASWLNQLVDTDISVFSGLKTILAGGEKLSEKHIGALKKAYPEIIVINGYGPTENTTFSLTHKITGTDVESGIPVGRPVSNRIAFIMNQHLHLLPVGVPGEICLGGAGLSRGYLNRSDLTAEKFISNPYSTKAGARLYKTGDIGRWLPDGNIEYLGRKDDQVKIRGYRIEPGEIETVLRQSRGVVQAVVLAPADKTGSKNLVAYVITDENFSREATMGYLKERLPAYMIPQQWVEMKSFPLTSNGKTDRRGLPPPDYDNQKADNFVAPTSETEIQLAEVWQQLLGREQIGIHENFFEMGGHSLLVVRMVPLLKKRFGLLVPIPVIFKFPTVYELGNYLEWQQEPEQEEEGDTTFELIKI